MRFGYGKIYQSVCLFVCLSVSMSVCLSQSILHLASDLFKIRHCLGLKYNFFGQRCPQVKTIQIGQHKENMSGDFGPPWLLWW